MLDSNSCIGILPARLVSGDYKLKGMVNMMRNLAILMACVSIAWVGGCKEEQQETSNPKMTRLIAVENKELKEKLQAETEKFNDEIRNLKTLLQQQDDQIKNLSQDLTLCAQVRDAKTDEIRKELIGDYEHALNILVDRNSELMAEIERLKADLAKIKEESLESKPDVSN